MHEMAEIWIRISDYLSARWAPPLDGAGLLNEPESKFEIRLGLEPGIKLFTALRKDGRIARARRRSFAPTMIYLLSFEDIDSRVQFWSKDVFGLLRLEQVLMDQRRPPRSCALLCAEECPLTPLPRSVSGPFTDPRVVAVAQVSNRTRAIPPNPARPPGESNTASGIQFNSEF